MLHLIGKMVDLLRFKRRVDDEHSMKRGKGFPQEPVNQMAFRGNAGWLELFKLPIEAPSETGGDHTGKTGGKVAEQMERRIAKIYLASLELKLRYQKLNTFIQLVLRPDSKRQMT